MGESSFVMAVGVSKLNDGPDNATKGTLRFNNATAMRTSLKKYKFGFLVFIAIIPSYTYYVKCTQTLLNLHSKGPYSSSEREIKFRCCLITFSIKHDTSHFNTCHSHAKTTKQSTKKRDAHAKLLLCLLNLIDF